MVLIKDLWRGDIPLSKTFWVFGFGVNLLLNMALFYLTIQDNMFTTNIGAAFCLLLFLFSFIYSPFILIGIWRSANKYQGLQRYVLASKIMVIIGWSGYIKSLAEFAKEFSS